MERWRVDTGNRLTGIQSAVCSNWSFGDYGAVMTDVVMENGWTRLDLELEVKQSSIWIQDRNTHGASEDELQ